ncbi:copper chaperone PCu(A)C [Shewanella sp. 202IG2-18]|uniref:copper chaperone PCu(A)C n=1 Tax=Parashewanella hymeniacidonis TaxID=2807618 RepID=UPI00195F90F5|nr:copper chaperone PCu(A)C [Parashewanella hymeniacidonis]MBM7070690.1 copper chaperone PCu(A)C [Parashewanella hymeniacidonis]
MEFRTLKKIMKISISLLIISGFSLHTFAAQISLVSGHVRALPPTVPNTAAYFTLKNEGANVKLIKAETPVAKEAQLHTLIEENGVVKMRQVPSYNLKAHSQLVLTSSGNHIMVMGLKQPLKVGQMVPLTLYFSDGTKKIIKLPVEKVKQEMDHHHHHH